MKEIGLTVDCIEANSVANLQELVRMALKKQGAHISGYSLEPKQGRHFCLVSYPDDSEMIPVIDPRFPDEKNFFLIEQRSVEMLVGREGFAIVANQYGMTIEKLKRTYRLK